MRGVVDASSAGAAVTIDDDQQVGDLGQREERRIEKGDDEQARAAEGERERLDPGDECFHRMSRTDSVTIHVPAHDRINCRDYTEPRAQPPLALLARRAGGGRGAIAAACTTRARPDAQPLRRARASRRRAAHRRQHHAGLAADRRGLAAAAAPAEHAAGAGRCVLSHRRVGRRDLDRCVRDRSRTRSRGSCCASTGSALAAASPAAVFALESERALPAVDADDRAAAARRCCALGVVAARTRRLAASERDARLRAAARSRSRSRA